MNWGKLLKGIAGIAAAPFTGGLSLALPAIGAVGGALQGRAGARTTKPVEDPRYAQLGDLVRQHYTQRLQAPVPLAGYEATGLQDINDSFAGAGAAFNNSLTGRGLARSPVAASGDATLQAARGGAMAKFLAGLPLLQRRLQGEDAAAAGGFYNAQPWGTEGPGSAAGGAFTNAAKLIAYLAANGHFGKSPLTGDPTVDGY